MQPLENTHAYTIYNFYVYQCLLQTSMACNRIIKHSGYCGELYKVHFFLHYKRFKVIIYIYNNSGGNAKNGG